MCIGVCLSLKILFVFDLECGRNLTLMSIPMHCNWNDISAFMFVDRGRLDHARTGGACLLMCLNLKVLFVFDSI